MQTGENVCLVVLTTSIYVLKLDELFQGCQIFLGAASESWEKIYS
jgi:hypothetical protein